MLIGKIGLNIFNIYPDNLKKDSERSLHKNSESKDQSKENTTTTKNTVKHSDTDFNLDKLHTESQKIKQVIEDYISNVKNQGVSINKFYPPYPPGSEDRIKLLKSFPLFREQIARFSLEKTEKTRITVPENSRIQELEAEIKSMEIKKSFADSGSYSITLNQSALLNMG